MTRKRVIVIAAAAVFLVLIGGVAFALTRKDDPAPPPAATATPSVVPPSASPAPPPGADITGPLDLLLIGVDTRVSVPDWRPHADTIMLLHLSPDLASGFLYSLPRALRVDMPAYRPAGFRGGRVTLT